MPDFLAIFDVDGTLVDSQGVIHATLARAFERVGLAPPAIDAVRARIGLSLPAMIEHIAGPRQVAEIAAAYRSLYVEELAAGGPVQLYPGVEAGLRRLRSAGITLGLATGKSRRGLDRLIERRGWADWFATRQCADDHPSKPHPSMIERALLETATEAGEAVMIGDTTYDMEMAARAGVTPLAVAWGYHEVAALRAAGAVAVVDDFDGLCDRIERMAR